MLYLLTDQTYQIANDSVRYVSSSDPTNDQRRERTKAEFLDIMRALWTGRLSDETLDDDMKLRALHTQRNGKVKAGVFRQRAISTHAVRCRTPSRSRRISG